MCGKHEQVFLSWWGFFRKNGNGGGSFWCDFMINFSKHGSSFPGNGNNSRIFPLCCAILAVLVLLLLVIGVVYFLHYTGVTAHTISAKYDLRNFVAVQEQYFAYNQRYLGSEGDFIEEGNPSSTLKFPLSGFTPSQGVVIKIVSGDGADFRGSPPFRAAAYHKEANTIFVYDFSSMKLTEMEREHHENAEKETTAELSYQ